MHYSWFQVPVWSNGGKNQNPKISLGLSVTPQKSLDQTLTLTKLHAEFPRLKNVQKWLSRTRTTRSGYAGATTNLQIVMNTQKNPGIKNFKHKKILWSSSSLEIWRPPPPQETRAFHKLLEISWKVFVISQNVVKKSQKFLFCNECCSKKQIHSFVVSFHQVYNNLVFFLAFRNNCLWFNVFLGCAS